MGYGDACVHSVGTATRINAEESSEIAQANRYPIDGIQMPNLRKYGIDCTNYLTNFIISQYLLCRTPGREFRLRNTSCGL